jgi:hypothetical protein
MLGRRISVPRPSWGPLSSSSGLKFFWSMNSWFCLIFGHHEHSLEGSRLNSCTCVVVLVMMVASPHLCYLNFLIYFSTSEACSSWSGPGCAYWGGGSRCWDPPKGLSSSGGLKYFWSINNWFYMNFDHPEHSLEGSRLNSCTCVVMLVVMVSSSQWSYLNNFFCFPSSTCSSCSEPGYVCSGRGSWCQDPPEGLQAPTVGWNIFDP